MVILSIFMVPLVVLSLIGVVIVMGVADVVPPRQDYQSDPFISKADKFHQPQQTHPHS